MSFPARYPGTCVECGTRVHVGDPITNADDDDGWVHTSCDDRSPSRDESPCQRCWLTICGAAENAARLASEYRKDDELLEDDRTDEPVMLRDALGAPLTLPTEGEVGQPAVGDLWVVSADGQDRGVVMISAVRDLHVLAWPVTLPTSAAAAPAFLITVPDTGDFVAWPDAEFGLALAALDRRLAHVLDDRTTRTIRWAVTEDEPVDSVSTCPAVDTPEAVAAFEAVCSQAWALGAWP